MRSFNDAMKAMGEVIEKAGYPVGTIRSRKRGRYKKMADGGWKRVSEAKPASASKPTEPLDQKSGEQWFDDLYSELQNISAVGDTLYEAYDAAIKAGDWEQADRAHAALKKFVSFWPDKVLDRGRDAESDLKSLKRRAYRKKRKEKKKGKDTGREGESPPLPPEEPPQAGKTPLDVAEDLSKRLADTIKSGTGGEIQDARDAYVAHMEEHPDLTLGNGLSMKRHLKNLDRRHYRRRRREKGAGDQKKAPKKKAPKKKAPKEPESVDESPFKPDPKFPGFWEQAGKRKRLLEDMEETFESVSGFNPVFTESPRDVFKDHPWNVELSYGARSMAKHHNRKSWAVAKTRFPGVVPGLTKRMWEGFCDANIYATIVGMPPVSPEKFEKAFKRSEEIDSAIFAPHEAKAAIEDQGFTLDYSENSDTLVYFARDVQKAIEGGLSLRPLKANRGDLKIVLKNEVFSQGERMGGIYFHLTHSIYLGRFNGRAPSFAHEFWHAMDAEVAVEKGKEGAPRYPYMSDGDVENNNSLELAVFVKLLRGLDAHKDQVKAYKKDGLKIGGGAYADYHDDPAEVFARFGEQLTAFRSAQAVAMGKMAEPTKVAHDYETYTNNTRRYYDHETFRRIVEVWDSLPAAAMFEEALAKALGMKWWADILSKGVPGWEMIKDGIFTG
jgi:hypothetical protein